jgi:hypothetical protein
MSLGEFLMETVGIVWFAIKFWDALMLKRLMLLHLGIVI